MKRERISPGKDFLMKLVALGFDVIGAILNLTGVGGTVTGLFGDLTFFLWYMIIGAPIFSAKSLRRAGIMGIVELIPFIDIFPGFSWFVWKQNKMVREEDERYNKEEEDKSKSKRLQEKQFAINKQTYDTKNNQQEDELQKAA